MGREGRGRDRLAGEDEGVGDGVCSLGGSETGGVRGNEEVDCDEGSEGMNADSLCLYAVRGRAGKSAEARLGLPILSGVT